MLKQKQEQLRGMGGYRGDQGSRSGGRREYLSDQDRQLSREIAMLKQKQEQLRGMGGGRGGRMDQQADSGYTGNSNSVNSQYDRQSQRDQQRSQIYKSQHQPQQQQQQHQPQQEQQLQQPQQHQPQQQQYHQRSSSPVPSGYKSAHNINQVSHHGQQVNANAMLSDPNTELKLNVPLGSNVMQSSYGAQQPAGQMVQPQPQMVQQAPQMVAAAPPPAAPVAMAAHPAMIPAPQPVANFAPVPGQPQTLQATLPAQNLMSTLSQLGFGTNPNVVAAQQPAQPVIQQQQPVVQQHPVVQTQVVQQQPVMQQHQPMVMQSPVMQQPMMQQPMMQQPMMQQPMT